MFAHMASALKTPKFGVASTIAAAGTGQSSGTAIPTPSGIVLVSGATGTTCVVLPTPVVTGAELPNDTAPANAGGDQSGSLVIQNTAGSALPIYPAGSGTINGSASPYSLAAGKTALLLVASASNNAWIAMQG